MNKKATDILSYIGWICWIIAIAAGTKEESKFHLNQGLVLCIFATIASVLATTLGFIPLLGLVFRIVFYAVDVFILVPMIMGIVAAANDEEKPLPVIGNIQILK